MITTEVLKTLNEICHLYWVERDRRITEWEGKFATDMVLRWERYGDKTYISDKQGAIINRIAAKLS